MNWLTTKIARARIKMPKYYEHRRQTMIRLAYMSEQNAMHRFTDNIPNNFNHWMLQATIYRKRAAWYVHKEIERKYKI